MSAREARDLRQSRLHRALDEVIRDAFVGNIASAAREYIAEEDFSAMLDAIVEALDEAGLSVVDREDLAAYLSLHQGNEDSGQWQDGHDYAMREAARLVSEAWDQIEHDQRATSVTPSAPTQEGAES
jgi:hypothetical protein